MRILRSLAGPLLLVAASAGSARSLPWSPESNAALRGEAAASKGGCFTCHGPEGRGGVSNPGSESGTVPGWDGGTLAMYVKVDEEFREWVLFGAPKRLRGANTPPVEKVGLIHMPSYRGFYSERELDDLVVYLRAVSGHRGEMPDGAYEGRTIAVRMGCFGCHGPSGMGGGANPGSFKGYIPSWTGSDFGELVRTDAELRAWIMKGRIARLWDNPLAARYLKRQKIQMPAYEQYLSEDDLKSLTLYIDWLRSP